MNNTEFPEDSDTSDEDYLPANGPAEAVSEVESDGDPEDPLSDNEQAGKRGRKRRKKAAKSRKNTKSKSPNDSDDEQVCVQKELNEVEKKKHADDLWASFKKDTGFKSKANDRTTESKGNVTKPSMPIIPKPKVPEKVKITQVFEFAGEEVKVEKEVSANSVEARLSNSEPSGSERPKRGTGRGGLGGIGSVLSRIGKKQKISTLEKSKLDWDNFKKEENLEEELQNFNKGKDGYLERQDFLQRTDLRRFEIEKEVRTVERNKRMNNV